MLQKLRIKFVLMAMAVLLLVLTVIIGTANLLNYRHILEGADYTLKLLISNNGSFPARPNVEGRPRDWKMSPERPFETRFFTVFLNQTGEITGSSIESIAAVTPELAASYGKEAFGNGREKGFVKQYRYEKKEISSGYLFVFLDCERQLATVKSFFFISAGISLAGFLTVSLLLYLLSGRIVRPIAESYEKQRQFITNASHDLKTPVTVIRADTDILEMEFGENEWICDIQKQAGRLSDLIQELVFLSRMEEKENQFQMIDFPISDVIHETALSFEALALSQEKNFSLKVQPMISYCGDEKTIRRLVEILLDNALKYSDEKGSIALSFEKADRSLSLTVHNTCNPISPQETKHFFERFYRGDKSRGSDTGGFGIGLSIAEAIIDAHRGSLCAASKDGRSLTVTASFPL